MNVLIAWFESFKLRTATLVEKKIVSRQSVGSCKVLVPAKCWFLQLVLVPATSLVTAASLYKTKYRSSRKPDYNTADQRNWVFATTSNFLISISVQPVGINIWNFKLRLFDLTESIVWNI